MYTIMYSIIIVIAYNMDKQKKNVKYSYNPPWKTEPFSRKMTTELSSKYISPTAQIQRYEKQHRPRAKSLNE